MKIEDGKIVQATEDELYEHYLKSGMDDIMAFPDYKSAMENCGVAVEGEKED